jgi:signal transduction histidine kinase
VSTAVSLGGWVTAGIVALVLVSLCRAVNGRTEAVARACHELRGPLAAARLGLTLGPDSRELPPGRLRAIDTELGRAALALDDLADPRRRAPQLRRCERVDVRALLSDSVEAWQASAGVAGVRLRMEWSGPRAQVWGDRLRLAQATGNLIANAIEHGGGAVAVQGSVRAGVVRVLVRDGGPGLPAPVAQLCGDGVCRYGRGWQGL